MLSEIRFFVNLVFALALTPTGRCCSIILQEKPVCVRQGRFWRSRSVLTRILPILLAFFVSACASAARPAAGEQPLVALLTDFGQKDHYAGALNGAIYSANRSARIDCITHQIAKFDVEEGAYTLAEAAREYPAGTIFVAVVDPGVGSSRRAIAVRTRNGKIFIGPDNGLLWAAAEEAGIVEAREITNRSLMRPGEISNTFHARDIFGPVAGHLAAGVRFEDVGPRVSHMVELPARKATPDGDRVLGHVVHVDEYGNLLTDVPILTVEEIGLRVGSCARLTVGGKEFKARYVRTYSDVDEGVPLFLNNRGFVEAAVNRGSLALSTGAAPGMAVMVERWNETEPPE